MVVAKQKQKCLSEEEVVDVDEEEVADEVEEEVEEEALTWGHPQQVRLANTVSRIGVLTYFILQICFSPCLVSWCTNHPTMYLFDCSGSIGNLFTRMRR